MGQIVINRHIFRGKVGRRTYMQYVCFHSTVTSLSVGMILYAKSSLELIVNNRIGKVGIRPLEPPSPMLCVPLIQTNRPRASLIRHWSHWYWISVCLSVCLWI